MFANMTNNYFKNFDTKLSNFCPALIIITQVNVGKRFIVRKSEVSKLRP